MVRGTEEVLLCCHQYPLHDLGRDSVIRRLKARLKGQGTLPEGILTLQGLVTFLSSLLSHENMIYLHRFKFYCIFSKEGNFIQIKKKKL